MRELRNSLTVDDRNRCIFDNAESASWANAPNANDGAPTRAGSSKQSWEYSNFHRLQMCRCV